jgi:5-methylthioadenosine/S-adenosylhomocysteine deaminase
MLGEARCAQLMQRARLRSAGALPPAELLRLATLDGARALGVDGVAGSLEPGRHADLCAVRVTAPHTGPIHDPCAALLLAARGSDVVLTAVKGRVLFRDGRYLTLDVQGLRSRVEEIGERLRRARDAG